MSKSGFAITVVLDLVDPNRIEDRFRPLAHGGEIEVNGLGRWRKPVGVGATTIGKHVRRVEMIRYSHTSKNLMVP